MARRASEASWMDTCSMLIFTTRVHVARAAVMVSARRLLWPLYRISLAPQRQLLYEIAELRRGDHASWLLLGLRV